MTVFLQIPSTVSKTSSVLFNLILNTLTWTQKESREMTIFFGAARSRYKRKLEIPEFVVIMDARVSKMA